MNRSPTESLSFLMILLFAVAARADDPLRALFIAGEPASGTESRVRIITSAISRQCEPDIEWETLRLTGTAPGPFPDSFLNTFESGAFDIVIYDLSPPAEAGEDWIDRILAPHRDGKPAVVISGGLSFKGEAGDWAEFCGAEIPPKPVDSPARTPGISITRANHPVTHLLGGWQSPADSPAMVKSLVENATRLATLDDHPACWTHLYGKREARVFAIAFGASEESIGHPSFLALLTRGFLWAASRNTASNFRPEPSLPDPVTKLRPGTNLITSNFQAAFSSAREPELACDGDPETAWKADPDDLISWWQVNLNRTVNPGVIVIHRDTCPPHPWFVESSPDGNTWHPLLRLGDSLPQSPVTLHEVDTSLSRKNFDRRLILSNLIREDIQIQDLTRILKSTDGDSRLKFHRIRLMEHFGVPDSMLEFLTRVMRDPNEAFDLRLAVATLLAENADGTAVRATLEWYGSLSAEDLLHLGAKKYALHTTMISNPTWEAQLEWILSTARSAEAESHRILAWEVITHLLTDPDSRPSSIERIRAFMEDLIAEETESGETSLPLFVSTTRNHFGQARVKEWLDRITSELPGTGLANLVASTKQEVRNARLVGELNLSSLETFLSESEPGDIERGRVLFAEACLHCHDRKAPPLAEAGPSLLDSLLHPDETISRETHTWTYQLVDGSSFTGFDAQEEATWHEVVDSAGNSVFLDKAEIEKRIRREGSTMPRDIVQTMTVGELADLMAYLEFLKSSRQ